jgi:DNA polymerase III subunit beta
MKILTVNSEHIAAGLSKVLKAKTGVNSLALLDCVHVKTIAGGMILTYNNLDTAIQTGVQAEVVQEGKEFLLNPQAYAVLNILKAEKAEIVFDIEATDKADLLTLTYEDNNLKFVVEKVQGYPAMPQLKKNVPSFTADTDTIKHLTKCLPYVSKDDLRPAITGIYFTNKGIAATDAHRLVAVKHDIDSKKEFAGIIRVEFVQALTILGENVKINISDSHISANDSNTMIVSLLIDAKFPDYQSVIPPDNNTKVTFFKEELKKNIKLATVLSAKSDRRMILDITADGYTMTGTDPDFDQEIILKAECKAKNKDGFENIRMGFNGAFFLNVLDSIDTEKITLCLSKPKTAGIIKDENTTYLIMPLMIQEKEEPLKQAA